MGDVVGLRVVNHIVGDVPAGARDRNGFAAKRFGETKRIGDAVALFLRVLEAPSALHVESHPWAVQTVCQPFRVSHEARSARVLADADKDALTRGPGAGNGA